MNELQFEGNVTRYRYVCMRFRVTEILLSTMGVCMRYNVGLLLLRTIMFV